MNDKELIEKGIAVMQAKRGDEVWSLRETLAVFLRVVRESIGENERIARLEAELAEAKAGWDSCIADLREAAEICKGVERQRDEARAQVERLSGPVSEQCEYSFGAYGGRLCELPRGHVEPHILSITERTKVIAARAKGGDHE